MSRYFPLFVNLEGKQVLVFGAGTIASRRIESLLEFGCVITVIAPEASETVRELAEQGRLIWQERAYEAGEISDDYVLVLAATSDGAMNRKIGQECREKQILVNVCSEKEDCDFYFPGLVIKDEVVIGVTAGGNDHKLAKSVTQRIREEMLRPEDKTE